MAKLVCDMTNVYQGRMLCHISRWFFVSQENKGQSWIRLSVDDGATEIAIRNRVSRQLLKIRHLHCRPVIVPLTALHIFLMSRCR